MSGITRRQARIMRRQIRKLYGSNFIPVLVPTAPISIGDILIDPKDPNAIIDSSVFPPDLLKSNEGSKNNTNITSSSGIELSVKTKGEGSLSEYFQLGEAGMSVNFSGENQMFLKLYGTAIRSMNNLPKFEQYILKRYSEGDLNAKVYIISSIIWSDKYYLQFSGKSGGTVVFDLKTKAKQTNIQADADFSFKWSSKVGYSIDGSNGGVLGYKVSAVRLRSFHIENEITARIQKGVYEGDALSLITGKTRKILMETNNLEIRDVTDQLILDIEDGML